MPWPRPPAAKVVVIFWTLFKVKFNEQKRYRYALLRLISKTLIPTFFTTTSSPFQEVTFDGTNSPVLEVSLLAS